MKRRAAFSALSAAGGLGESHRERRKQSKEIAWPKVKQNSLYQKEVKGRKGPREALARYCDDAIYTVIITYYYFHRIKFLALNQNERLEQWLRWLPCSFPCGACPCKFLLLP